MTKEKQITIKMNVRSAAAVRQVLFEAQRGYSYEHSPERIVDLRSVIKDIDNLIENTLGNS